jgi:hypothetical protein
MWRVLSPSYDHVEIGMLAIVSATSLPLTGVKPCLMLRSLLHCGEQPCGHVSCVVVGVKHWGPLETGPSSLQQSWPIVQHSEPQQNPLPPAPHDPPSAVHAGYGLHVPSQYGVMPPHFDPHIPQFCGSLSGLTHTLLQQRRPVPHTAPPHVPPPPLSPELPSVPPPSMPGVELPPQTTNATVVATSPRIDRNRMATLPRAES